MFQFNQTTSLVLSNIIILIYRARLILQGGSKMKKIKPQDIFKVSTPGISTCLSIYVNHPSEIASQIEEVERVSAVDLDLKAIENLLAPIKYLMSTKKWILNDKPLGIFVTQGFAGFTVLPFETKPISVVANSFHVKPLLRWMQNEKPFSVLHFEVDRAYLYLATASEIRLHDEILFVGQKSLSHHVANIESQVHAKLSKLKLPLVLSGVQSMVNVYKTISRAKNIFSIKSDERIDTELADSLRIQSLEVLGEFFDRQESQLLQKYWTARVKNLTTSNLNEIVNLALKGEVKSLYINEKLHIWGQINYRTGKFTYHPRQLDAQDEDILDDLAEIVLYHKGEVFVLPTEKMPESQAAAAILRSPQRLALRRESLPIVGRLTDYVDVVVER